MSMTSEGVTKTRRLRGEYGRRCSALAKALRARRRMREWQALPSGGRAAEFAREAMFFWRQMATRYGRTWEGGHES